MGTIITYKEKNSVATLWRILLTVPDTAVVQVKINSPK